MCDVVMVPHDISFLLEYNAVGLCYPTFNCLIRSHSYITYNGSAKGTRALHKELSGVFTLKF